MSDTSAIELLKRAVQLDSEQKFPDALTCYSEGIRMLLAAVKGKRYKHWTVIYVNHQRILHSFIRYSIE
jgi:hypothetical protein